MSSGSVTGVVVPLAVTAVLGMAAGAAVSVALSSSLGAIGGSIDRRHRRWEQDQCAEATWEQAAVQVIARNALIAVNRKAVKDALADPGGPPRPAPAPLPEPLALRRQSLADLQNWCTQADVALAASETFLQAATTRRAASLLTRSASGRRAEAAIQAWAKNESARTESLQPAVNAAEAAAPRLDIQREIAAAGRVMDRVPAAARTSERADIAAAAARVVEATSVVEARNRLDDLRTRAELLAGMCELRMADAREASAYLQPLAHLDDAEALLVRQALEAVASGARQLDDALRAEALQWAETVRAAAERQYLREVVVGALEDLEYDVVEEFSTLTPEQGRLAVSRSGWRQHQVLVVLDHDTNEMRAMVVRNAGGEGLDASRQDLEREEEWCDSLDALSEALGQNGVDLTVVSRTKPGSRPLPRVARQEQVDHRRRDRQERSRS
ncbi:hypothetical protein ACFWUU_12730 [Kribbella sp. NPDC058693]|uniref:hypothetical protein n=1 Tax=Kribbella sp. NPDC058693 TaxID=3346602 RepID=UPI00365DDCE8